MSEETAILGIVPQLAAPPSTCPRQHLFNADNLDNYTSTIAQGLALVAQAVQQAERPFTGILAEELRDRFEGLDLARPAGDLTQALEEIQALYLNDAVYFHHPRYAAHLNCPVAIPAILAELITSAINTSVDTWDQSAGATLIEQKLIDWTAGSLGLGRQADGVFTSGGTQSNLMALLLARDHACESRWQREVKTSGLPASARRLRIYTSAISHFSVQKAAALLGLGYDAVVAIPCDSYFRLDAAALAKQMDADRSEGLVPAAVVATAGTTDFGSIDPLERIGRICRERGVWMHVDAAYGCGLLVSRRHRHLLDGVEQADSVTVDYHKSFLQPVSCSALLVRNHRHLGCVTYHADYLNPLDQRQEGTPNLVDKSLQTTRRFDALKLWLTLRIMGPEALGKAFDQVIHLARQTYLLLLSDPDLEVIHQPRLSAVVFRYRPSGFSDAALDAVNGHIRKAMLRDGEALVAGTSVQGRRCLKFTFLNPVTSIADVQEMLRMIKRHGGAFLRGQEANIPTRRHEVCRD